MKKIFIVFLISIAFARLYALEKPKKEYEKYIENNKADLMNIQIQCMNIMCMKRMKHLKRYMTGWEILP